MSFFAFIRDNLRWLAGGLFLTLFSSFGQTFFISLSAGQIREEYGLTHGGFGTLYMLATLASALSLPYVGRIVDYVSVAKVTLLIIPMLALAAVSMALSHHIALLALTIYGLRLFGQGMMTHNAITAMGRWYVARRGRAVSIATLGHQCGEATLPFAFVLLSAAIGWRSSWLVSAAFLMLVALPLIYLLMRVERQPRSTDGPELFSAARDWTRAEVMRDPTFWILLLGVLAPGFIGTTIFFHQVYLVELRGWTLELFAGSFLAMSIMTVIFALIGGALVDRFSAVALLPSFLIPLGLSCMVLSLVEQSWGVFAFMGLLGISYGLSSTLFGALWPEIYGSRYLGSIRSVVVALLVFATAMGPGVTGFLIDAQISYPLQIAVMGLYSFAMCFVMLFVSRKIIRRKSGLVAQAVA
ncbi:MFS transporter [Hoeflea sp. WL0058]|uniref:MFS transporter n=1 Tax=Flavimaribacter sediminis TaxID=2865987 RepID=A0AAE2ZN70_9HYPH|nr:MFS transporter [Flavimaribacter sediminis]MBW8636437.1 MFS transporter [Flavimaribacter sediminis]